MMFRIAIGVVAALLLALGAMNAANKAGLLGPRKPPTRVVAGDVTLMLPPVWHSDTGEFAGLRDGVCKLVAPARSCAAWFIKGLGSPRALAVVAAGPIPAGGAAGLGPALSAEGIEVSGPDLVEGVSGAQRYHSRFKKRGRNASLAVTDAVPAGTDLLVLQVVAEDAEGRYQSQLLADIEKTLEARPQ